MSNERELRRELPLHLCPDEGGEHCPYCERAWGLLAADPDVVAVLRAIKKLQPDSSCPLTLSYLAHQIEQQFHVRLTDDGWEWTDEC